MFLKYLTLTLSLMFSTSFAQKMEISEGKYILTEGPAQLCSDFVLSKRDKTNKTVRINTRFAYNFENSKKDTQSDIDERCFFRELNKMQTSTEFLTLERVNSEICQGKLIHKVISQLLVKTGELQLTHQVDRIEPVVCKWVKE